MTSFIRALEPGEAKYDCECQEEDVSIDVDDEQTRKWIRDELAAGNTWAWCVVRVRASWNGFVGEAYLGGCSYKSKEDFVENSGYWEDMCTEAFNDLLTGLERMAQRLEPLVSRESVDAWIVAKVQDG